MARADQTRWASRGIAVLALAMIAAGSERLISPAAAGPSRSPRPPARTAEPAYSAAVLQFGDDLGSGDVRLAGAGESRRIAFACEAGWKILPGSELHLLLEHSEALDPDRSFLSITLNGGILRSLRLDETNQAPTEVVIPLPPTMLRPSNELVVSAVQFGRAGAPEAAAWSLVHAGSYVSVAYAAEEAGPSLQRLPVPLLDPASYRPHVLSVALPERPSAETLEATSLVVGYLAMKVAPKPLRLAFVRSPAELDRPILAVGTPAELPSLVERVGGKDVRFEGVGSRVFLHAGGARLDPTHGVIGVAMRSGSKPLLFVTAESPAGVLRAARALAGADVGLRGAVAVARGNGNRRPPEPREWRGHVPPGSRFTLGNLGYVEGLVLTADSPLRIPIRTTPDARFLARAHSVTLSFTLLPALFDVREGSVDVSWNGVNVASYPVSQLEEGRFSVSVKVPPWLLRGENDLTVACRGAEGALRAPLAALSSETSFYLPRAYSARLPDLALLQSSLYPLSLRADLSDLVVVLPDGGREALVPLVCELAALLGRLAPSDRLAFRVRQPKGLASSEREAAHLLLLEIGDGPSLVSAPALDWQRLPNGSELRKVPMLQELVSPWNPERFVLRLTAKDADGLLRGVRRLGEPDILTHLVGDTAFLGSQTVCYLVGRQREFKDVSYATVVEAWLQSHWLALPLIVAAVSGGVYLALRAALRQHRAAHLAGSKGTS